MVGVLVVTHGGLAQELVRTASMIFGQLERVEAVGLLPDETEESMLRRIGEALSSLDDGDGVLVLVDMFGGTPSNLSLRSLQQGKVEVVTGVNLPMLLKLGGSRRQALPELAQLVRAAGARNVLLASEFLRGK